MDGGSSVFAGAKNCPFILNIKKAAKSCLNLSIKVKD